MGEPTPPRTAGEGRSSESEHLAAIVRSADDAVLSKDRNAIITSWNEGAVQLYGYTAEEMVGQSVSRLLAPGREGEEMEIVGRILSGQRVQNYETERVRKDGSLVPVSLAASPIFDAAGEIVGVSTVARSLSQTQAALAGAERRFESAFHDAPIGMSVFDVRPGSFGQVEEVNAAMHRLLGYTAEEFNQLEPLSLTHPDDAPRERPLVEELIAGKRDSYELEKRNRHKDGHWVWLNVNVSLLRDEDPPRFAIAHVSDISTRKGAEEELARAQANLERSNAELDQFAYVASHDLKEPLILLSAYARMLEERHADSLEEEAVTFLGHIRDEAVRMRSMIDDLLDYSRLETRSGESAPVDLNEVAAAACRTLEPRLEETGGRIDIAEDLPTVAGSQSQFERLFRNLLSNAIKFHGDEAPVVAVTSEKTDSGWKIAVSDNGIGIDPAKADRVFDVFQRLHSQERYPGTGMGLAICKRIVERHGGEISVEPGADRGSVFSFTLPG